MRCVITGGAGFIGSNLVEALLAAGDEVVVLDDFSTGRRQNIASFASDITLLEGDIRDEALLDEAFADAEVVFHQAALPSVARSVEDPASTHDVNAGGTLKVLLAAKKAGVRRVVSASSSSVYGDTPILPKVESMAPSPLSPYAVSKLAAENYCRIFPSLYGLETVSLRYFNVFGPRQDPKSHYAAVVPIFITRLLTGQAVTIEGDGGQSRDFTFIENVVQANLLAASTPAASGGVFNVGVGRANTILELYEAICDVTGIDSSPHHGPVRPGDVRHSLADISRAREILGYDPTVQMREGLEKTIDSFR